MKFLLVVCVNNLSIRFCCCSIHLCCCITRLFSVSPVEGFIIFLLISFVVESSVLVSCCRFFLWSLRFFSSTCFTLLLVSAFINRCCFVCLLLLTFPVAGLSCWCCLLLWLYTFAVFMLINCSLIRFRLLSVLWFTVGLLCCACVLVRSPPVAVLLGVFCCDSDVSFCFVSLLSFSLLLCFCCTSVDIYI